jgi:polysaccharide export outer membrane protein
MERTRLRRRGPGWRLVLPLAVLLACGCQTVRTPENRIAKSNLPRELTKTSLPDYVVEPPDLIQIEVLEALPGRPITGERLVRPDGKISLGFYGDLYVAGLTTDEIKEKVIIHLRKFIPDATLGLVEEDENGQIKAIPPVESDRVFVDVSSYNSKAYYVQGDVGQPGRLPITGNETVLDAINYAGGLLPTASYQDIRLVRPAPPGACCQQVLPVNYSAIVNAGDTTTNYQLLPGDRLVVYRDPIERTGDFLTRLARPFQITLGAIQTYSFAARSVKSIDAPLFGTVPTTTPVTR